MPLYIRSPVLAFDGMVASSQPLASQAALGVLRMGGNAVDATIAAAAALAVLEPCSNGIGGDLFLIAYSRHCGAVTALNGSGHSPANLNIQRARLECGLDRTAETLPPTHAHTVTVPGAIAAWCDALDALGSGLLPMRALLAPAIDLAENGFPVGPVTAHFWAQAEGLIRRASPAGPAALLTEAGRAPRACQTFKRPALARVLRGVAHGGRSAFYDGHVAAAIVDAVDEAGGCLSEADLHDHTSDFVKPISVDFFGARVWEAPPNGGGITALLALNILRVLEEDGVIPPWPERPAVPSAEEEALLVHAQIESVRLAYADTAYYVGDPCAVQVPVHSLLSDDHARARARLFDPARALADVPRGAPREESCTVSFQVVDGCGNAVSALQSNYMGFGTGIVPADCGFTLHNRGLNFSMQDGAPNALAPRKRPYHTILPCVLTDVASGDLVATLSNMGGYMQPQGHVQLVCKLVRRRMCPQEAVDTPRFCVSPLFQGTAPASPRVALECTFAPNVIEAISARGHQVTVVEGHKRSIVGRAQVIARTADGVLVGGSDGRADGAAVGLHMA